MERDLSLPVRIYTLSWKGLAKLYRLADACLAGFWLGVLDREALHQVDRAYYDGQEMYRRETYNRQGLFAWEAEAVRMHFSACKKLLVIGAGGGREVLALARHGFEVDGYECHPALVQSAQSLLSEERLPAEVQLCPRDGCPPGDPCYDGLVVGWSAYMLIQGRRRRVAFLQALRRRARPGAPLLLSFFTRRPGDRRFRLICFIANFFRRLRFSELVEPGDDLDPNYVHHFTQEELASELRAGGFSLVTYNERLYGHAIASAV